MSAEVGELPQGNHKQKVSFMLLSELGHQEKYPGPEWRSQEMLNDRACHSMKTARARARTKRDQWGQARSLILAWGGVLYYQ